MSSLIQTALYPLHQASGAKCIGFAGYNMPVWFSTQQAEHLAVRSATGVFDISYMGLFQFSGPGADTFMQRLSCNRIEPARHRKMIYSMILNEAGMILDDVMFGNYDGTWHLIANAANTAKLHRWFEKHKPADVHIEHSNATHSLLAIQGPTALATFEKATGVSLSSLKRFGMQRDSVFGAPAMVCRTGYTGEDGCEVMLPHEQATQLWQACCEAGATPCGLAARDTLRIEVGLPLYGQELSEHIHPFMTRYSWVVKLDQDFIGRDALQALKAATTVTSVGLELSMPIIARLNYPIKEGGTITSGTLSPKTGKSIAMGFVPKEQAAIGTPLTVQIRNKEVAAQVVAIPFS